MLSRTTLMGPQRLFTRAPHIVYVTGNIDEAQFEHFAKQFAAAVTSGQKIIPVVIHSTGGNLVEALSMTSLMRAAPAIVATVVPAQAYSAAALVFSAGTSGYRFCGENATLMLHQVSVLGIGGTVSEVDAEARELVRTNKQAFRHMSRNIGRSDDYLQTVVDAAGCDLYLDAAQSVEHGLANKIGVPHFETRLFAELHLVNASAWTSTGRVLDVGAAAAAGTGKRKREAADDSDSDDD